MLPALEQKLEFFRRSDQERDALLQEVIRQYGRIQIAYTEKCEDVENEAQARRYWQQQFGEASKVLAMTRQQAESTSFVLALIDGDGAIFTEDLLRAGVEGGSDAAHKLQSEMNHILDVYEGAAGNWSVMVYIYANVEGLSRKLASVGIIKSPVELYTFTRAFNLHQPLFNFIDVGSGKERADHKIKEMLRLFTTNIQCKHIIFSGCHDNGYLPCLDPYKHDLSNANRISLLETTPVQPGFTALKFKTVRFSSVFRLDELPERPPPVNPIIVKTVSSHQTIVSPQRVQLPISKGARSATPVPTQSSCATVRKKGMNTKDISIAPVKPRERKFVLLNAYDQRIDEKLAKVERDALDRFHAKIQKQKMCNEYHLKGSCSLGGSCPYHHGEKLSPVERLVLQHKVRNIPCSFLNNCREVNCYYGHNCPYDECSRGNNCYFSMTHDMDKAPRMKMYEDGTIDIVT
ncbi:Zinc finger CCCH-type protein [Macrophomina phaseolina MS6]|uniref:Zinc finger CCCH-type protein n=1 Tax=Macrophomina phaseolina (strain MS6) TaxID=1126212 RepID=K2RGZ4_MACPH|nr:Zinc finger CCCH-type protein [Macrophomina phaseolina MS6]